MHVLRFESPDNPSTPTSESSPEPVSSGSKRSILDRNHTWDWVRAIAALLVVLLHSAVAYLRYPVPGLAWPTQDGSSRWVDGVFWSIEIMIMPLFLVMAGFLAWQSLQHRGPNNLFRTRARRLVPPLLFGCLVILPLDLYIWIDGWVIDGIVPLRKMRSLKLAPELSEDLWGLSHLWFLPYLLTYVGLLAAWAAASQRFRPVRRTTQWLARRSPQEWVAALFLAASTILLVRPEVVWGFQHAFLPIPSKWAYCALFFAAGGLVANRDGQLRSLVAARRRLAPIGIATGMGALLMGYWHLAGPIPSDHFNTRDHFVALDTFSVGVGTTVNTSLAQSSLAEQPFAAALLAGLTVATAAIASLVAIGVAGSIKRPLPAAIRFLSAASFWIYLVHHPLVGLLHIDLKYLMPGVSPELKFTVCSVLAIAISSASYQIAVRRTRFGNWLGLAERVSPVHGDLGQNAGPTVLTMPDAEPVPQRRAA